MNGGVKMIRVHTKIFQAGDTLQTKLEAPIESIGWKVENEQLALSYQEKETQTKVDLLVSEGEIQLFRKGEVASQLLFQHQKKTKGHYQLAQGQEILFEIKTKNVEVSSDWKQISFEYQLSQLGENLGEFTVNIEILKENIVQ
jgi:hypothetical protein